MEYPKINSIWKRDEANALIPGDYARPEFSACKQWRVEEKIDGTNIRVYIQDGGIEIKGRTNKAEIPAPLLAFFARDEFMNKLPYFGTTPVQLFGEGFGASIQSGGIYRPDVAFILFDVYMSNRWSTREEVQETALALGLDCPADLGIMTEEEIIAFVKSKPKGRYNDKGYPMEGVMVRSQPLMRFNTQGAAPVMWKLKVKDFYGKEPKAVSHRT